MGGTYGNNTNSNAARSNQQMSYDYETVRHNLSGGGGERGGLNNSFQQRMGSIKHSSNGHPVGITINANGPLLEAAQPHWKTAAMYGFAPASLNSSARSRGPYVTHVTLGGSNSSNANTNAAGQQQQQPTYQTVQKQQQQHHHHAQQQKQQQSQYSGAAAGAQHAAASKM